MQHNIFDGTFNAMGGGEMYRAAVMPDMYPEQKPWDMAAWPEDEREIYCGVYTPERRAQIQAEARELVAA